MKSLQLKQCKHCVTCQESVTSFIRKYHNKSSTNPLHWIQTSGIVRIYLLPLEEELHVWLCVHHIADIPASGQTRSQFVQTLKPLISSEVHISVVHCSPKLELTVYRFSFLRFSEFIPLLGLVGNDCWGLEAVMGLVLPQEAVLLCFMETCSGDVWVCCGS